MKDVFLVYDRCCFYEIVILSYFLNYSHCDLVFCSPDGKPVRAMEGFSVHVDASLRTWTKRRFEACQKARRLLQMLAARNMALGAALKISPHLIAALCAVSDGADDDRDRNMLLRGSSRDADDRLLAVQALAVHLPLAGEDHVSALKQLVKPDALEGRSQCRTGACRPEMRRCLRRMRPQRQRLACLQYLPRFSAA